MNTTIARFAAPASISRLMWAGALAFGLGSCTEKPAEEAKPTEEAKPAEEGQKAPEVAAKPGEEGQKAAAPAVAAPVAVAPAPEPQIPPPADVCSELIMALKAKDEVKVLSLSTPASAAALSMEGAKARLMQALHEGMCGAAKVDGDMAVVMVQVGSASQDLPFAKADNAWRFDAPTYFSKYPPAPAAKAAHKAKAAHGKKHKK